MRTNFATGRRMRGAAWALLSGATLLHGCGAPARPEVAAPRDETNTGSDHAHNHAEHATHAPTVADTTPRHLPGLHNVVAYHDGFWSGGVPEGDEAFATLAAMGVTTIISVDGAAPDVEAARRHGLRYIHLPIGYNGFDETRELELARATRDAIVDGPVYIHCHHGKHRSAGAAGTIAVNLGWATPEAMVERMRVSGTSPSYRGLYGCTMTAVAYSPAQLDSISGEFPEVSIPTGMVAAMVEIDEVFEHLKAIEAAGWAPPSDHPDLVPVAEAGRLENLFRTMSQHESSTSEGTPFVEMMVKDAERSAGIESMLDQPAGADDPPAGSDAWRAELSSRLAELASSCKECHTSYRD